MKGSSHGQALGVWALWFGALYDFHEVNSYTMANFKSQVCHLFPGIGKS